MLKSRVQGASIVSVVTIAVALAITTGGSLRSARGQAVIPAAPAMAISRPGYSIRRCERRRSVAPDHRDLESLIRRPNLDFDCNCRGDFSVDPTSSTCPAGGGLLPAGATCNISVRFIPQGPGTRTGILRLISNAPGSPHMLPIQGVNGQAPPSPAKSVDMSQVPESQPIANPSASMPLMLQAAPPPPPFVPNDIPKNVKVAPPALRSTDAVPPNPAPSDVSFSGGRGPISVPAGGYCGTTQCPNGCYCWSSPEDASVAEGNGYVLAASNDQITIHDSNGTLVANKDETKFWSSIALGHPISDPTVGYSWENNQWFMAAMDLQLTDITYLAASKTGNPDGGWWFFSLTGCPDSPFGDRPILGVGANYILLTIQCPESSTGTGGFYAIDHNNLLNGTLGNPPPALQSIPNFYAPVTDSFKTDTFTQYLLLPNVDSQQNVSVSVATLTSTGSYDPTAVVNYPLAIQANGTVPFGNQAADTYGNPACSGCIGSRNSIAVQDEAFKIADTSFNNYFGYDTIYASLSVGLPGSAAVNGALIVAAIQPDAPAGQQSYSMLYQSSTTSDTFTYGTIAGACPGNPGPTNGCCRGGQWLLGYDYLSSSSLPSEAYITGTLTPSGLSLSSTPSVFKTSDGQSGALNISNPPGNQCVVNGPSNNNPACRWGDYSFTFWNIGNAGHWWTDENYAYHWDAGGGKYVDTWADWVAGVSVPTPPACQ